MARLGVVIVTYNSETVIRDCLETLLGSDAEMRVAIVDNASPDATLGVIEGWRSGQDAYVPRSLPFECAKVQKPLSATKLQVLAAPSNNGFAAGVNLGIQHLLQDANIDRIWILNPDTITPHDTPNAIASAPSGFDLMGGRILYLDPPHAIQIDGGTLNRWTGVTGNINLGRPADSPSPNLEDAAFISGASMVASRAFIERAGPMPEDYFLYYEEVDWALRRGALPLVFCPDATIFHRAGTSIGSPTLTSGPSVQSAFYKHRARMMFLRRWYPLSVPTGYLYGLA